MSALLQHNRPLTLQEALRQLAAPPPGPRPVSLDNHFATARNVPEGAETAEIPYIRHGSKHWAYAVLIVAGMSNAEACEEVGISPRTAEGYRTELREAVSKYIGRSVEYHFAARYIMDEELRRQCGRPSQPITAYPS